MIANQRLDQMEKYFWPHGLTRDVWMLVDAARDRRIFSLLLECHLEYSNLYSGPTASALEMVAPYLVQLDYQYRDTYRFLSEAWGQSWGVWLRCDAPLDRLRRHLRGFTVVRDPRGQRLVFRYYDPRVLRVYLPTCNPGELRTVYGPIERFWMEDEEPGTLLEFRFHQVRLERRRLSLEPSEAVSEAAPASAASWTDGSRSDEVRSLPLTIRQEQLDEFSRREVRKFEDWVYGHLRKFFSDQCAAAGEEEIRGRIRYGIRRAGAYGITSQRDVCKFIDLIMMLGPDFEVSPRFPWAMEILKQPADSVARIAALTDYTENVLRGA